jgi:superfamily II DNA helicase RecQ
VLALTATADNTTQQTICKELLMVDAAVIFLSPHRENLRFSVAKCAKEEMHKKLDWLVKMVKEMGIEVPKTIIFCNTMKEMSVVVNHLMVKLDNFAYHPTTSSRKEDLLLGIYHSVTWKANKEKILKSLAENGSKRIIVATTALSMGVNFLDIRYIVNWGPARSLLDQHQEAGRAGRDGKQSHIIIIYHGQQLANCEDDVKSFVQTQDCYRVAGYKPFDATIKPLGIAHNCCSNCAKTCLCGPGICNSSTLPFEQKFQGVHVTESSVIRTVTPEHKECIREAFHELRNSMPSGCNAFGKTTSHAFSKKLIDSIVENCHRLFQRRRSGLKSGGALN